MAAIIVSRRLQTLLLSTSVPATRVIMMKQLSSVSWSVASRVLAPKTLFTSCVLNSQNTNHDDTDLSEELWPHYVIRLGEEVERKRARLFYQSRKRGMLENGLILSTFASRHLADMTPTQLDQYDDIINRPSNDWKLYYWMTGHEETPSDYDNEVMDMLKSHARNEDREMRYRQPDLTERDCSMRNQ